MIRRRIFMTGVVDLLESSLDATYARERPQEVFLANCSAGRTRRLLGYEPNLGLRGGLKGMIDYIIQPSLRHFTFHLDLAIVNEIAPDTWVNSPVGADR